MLSSPYGDGPPGFGLRKGINGENDDYSTVFRFGYDRRQFFKYYNLPSTGQWLGGLSGIILFPLPAPDGLAGVDPAILLSFAPG